MKDSSKPEMQEVYNILKNIQLIDTPNSQYDNILTKINAKNTIPMSWVSVAACIFILLFTAEIYFGIHANTVPSKENTSLICITKNNLYDE